MTDMSLHHAPTATRTHRREDLARIAFIALVFANAWLGLAHLDTPRPEGTAQDWHGNVAASTPR